MKNYVDFLIAYRMAAQIIRGGTRSQYVAAASDLLAMVDCVREATGWVDYAINLARKADVTGTDESIAKQIVDHILKGAE